METKGEHPVFLSGVSSPHSASPTEGSWLYTEQSGSGRDPMKLNGASVRTVLAAALAVALNLASVYSFACPILCSAQRCCAGREGAATMPVMPHSQPCCPDQSGGTKRAPCSTPASQCLSHTQCTVYLLPAAISIPQVHSLSVAAPLFELSLLSWKISLVKYSSLSPPGYSSSGRAICQSESYLRI